jgi:uncharacterized membrane protein YfcA
VPAFLAIAVTSSVAAPFGAHCSQGLPEKLLKKIFAVIALVLSLKMLLAVTQ